MTRLVAVKPSDGFKLWLRYADGTEGEVDLGDLAGQGVFKAWHDPKVFNSVRLDQAGVPVWDGDIDLCPDSLYLRLTGKQPADLFPSLRMVHPDA